MEQDTNGNGRVSYKYVANTMTTLAVLVIGALIGYLFNTTVPRAELRALVEASYQTHTRMEARDDAQDAKILTVEEASAAIRTDVAAIRAILERVERDQLNGKR